MQKTDVMALLQIRRQKAVRPIFRYQLEESESEGESHSKMPSSGRPKCRLNDNRTVLPSLLLLPGTTMQL